MSGRNEVNTQNKMKTFFREVASFDTDQQGYLTGNERHQMKYTELSKFGRLDEENGIDSFLKLFVKPLPKVERGTGGADDVVRVQEVRLDATQEQDVRKVHTMHHYYIRAGHEFDNLPKEFFSKRRVAQFKLEFRGFPKKDDQKEELKACPAKASPAVFKKTLDEVYTYLFNTCEPGQNWGSCALVLKADYNPDRPDLINNP